MIVQVAMIERKHLEELMKEFLLARRKIRAATFRMAFTRAMVSLAKVRPPALYRAWHRRGRRHQKRRAA